MENQVTLVQSQGALSTLTTNALGIFGNKDNYNLACNLAKSFSASTIVPKDYQNNAANCLIAIDMSTRLGVAPLMVMQQLYIVNGRPAWSSQFLAAMINNSRRFRTPIKYDMGGDGDTKYCIAYVVDHDGERIAGPKIDIKMAKDEGWYGKNGSKWRTMPDVMLRYRAVSFFARLHCGDLTMGMNTADEVIETNYQDYSEPVSERVEHEISASANSIIIDVNAETGEVMEDVSNEEPVQQTIGVEF